MRKIRIKLSPPDLSGIPSLQVEATSYLISKSMDFDTESNILVKNLKDTKNKYEYITDLDIGPNTTVYVRVMFHFKDVTTEQESTTKWSRTTPVSADLSGFTLSDIIIRTPVVEVDKDQDTIIIQSKPIALYSGGAKHSSSTWQVTDSYNVPIYDREKDVSTLVKLRTQSIGLDSNKAYMFKVRHETETGNESTFGKKLVVDYNRGLILFDFKLLNKFIIGVKQYYQLIMYAPKFKSLDIEVRTLDGRVVIGRYDQTKLSGYFETNDLESNTVYEIYVRVKFTDNQVTVWKKVYAGTCSDSDPDGIYGDGTANYPGTNVGGNDINFGDIIGGSEGGEGSPKRQASGVTSTYELSDGSIIFTEFVNNAISLFRFDGTYFSKVKRLVDLTAVDLGIDYVNVLPLPSGDIVINYSTINDSRKYQRSVWKKYTYDIVKKVLTETNSKEVITEKYSTAMSTSAIIANDGSIYYIPAVEIDSSGADVVANVYKIDATTFEISKVIQLPNNIKYNASFIRDIAGNMYLFGGSTRKVLDKTTKEDKWTRENNKVYTLNVSGEEPAWIDTKLTLPEGWSTDIYSMQGYLRHDYKIMLFNSVHNGSMLGQQKALVFDPIKKTFNVEELNSNMRIPFRNNIVLNDGSILRISSKEQDPQRSYIYVADNNYSGEQNRPDQGISDLVVKDGTIVEIEDPYFYNSITIQGTGRLRWIGTNQVREFTSSDLIVTRSQVMEQAIFDKGKYENVFILDGVEFTISG